MQLRDEHWPTLEALMDAGTLEHAQSISFNSNPLLKSLPPIRNMPNLHSISLINCIALETLPDMTGLEVSPASPTTPFFISPVFSYALVASPATRSRSICLLIPAALPVMTGYHSCAACDDWLSQLRCLCFKQKLLICLRSCMPTLLSMSPCCLSDLPFLCAVCVSLGVFVWSSLPRV